MTVGDGETASKTSPETVAVAEPAAVLLCYDPLAIEWEKTTEKDHLRIPHQRLADLDTWLDVHPRGAFGATSRATAVAREVSPVGGHCTSCSCAGKA